MRFALPRDEFSANEEAGFEGGGGFGHEAILRQNG